MRSVAVLTMAAVTVVNAVLRNVTIDNLKPRLDVNGVIIDAHDGSVQQFGGRGLFYMHAVQYGLCAEPANYGCDVTPNHCGFHVRGREHWQTRVPSFGKTTGDTNADGVTLFSLCLVCEARPQHHRLHYGKPVVRILDVCTKRHRTRGSPARYRVPATRGV